MVVRFELDKIVGAAHIEFAKRDGVKPPMPRQIESRRAAPLTPIRPPVGATLEPDLWGGLHENFRALAEEELSIAPHNTGDRWLRAYVDYKGRSSECGEWHISSGISESFRERFEVEATRAGIAVNSTFAGEPGNVWLHHVFLDLLPRNSKLLFCASKEGGIIVRACEASAIYCARLE